MADNRLVATGLIGIVTVALCCFTPILVALLAAVGLSAAIVMLDYVLLPAAAVCLVLLVWGLVRRRCA
jgi:mercuric ion transport protein